MNQEDENKDRRKFFRLPFAVKFSHLISSDCFSLFGLGWAGLEEGEEIRRRSSPRSTVSPNLVCFASEKLEFLL